LNLSKSVNLDLVWALCIFFAKGVSPNFFKRSNFSTAVFNSLDLTALGMSNLKSVKLTLLNEISCLLTPVVGPSTKTLLVVMISTITANFPDKGP